MPQQKTESKIWRDCHDRDCKYFIKPRYIVQSVVCCGPLSEKLRLSSNSVLQVEHLILKI